MNTCDDGTLSFGIFQQLKAMRFLAALSEYINKRRDTKIVACLRNYEVLTETELQLRTGIHAEILRARLRILVEEKLVSRYGTDQRPIWRIHHPPR